MSAFIVISGKESLHQIVDGIEKHLPLNPDVNTLISTGKILEKEGKLLYQYTFSGKETGSEAMNSLKNLLANQIAQFLAHTKRTDINIFFLDNPLNDDEVERSNWIIDEINTLYETRKHTNFRLIRILFSYDIEEPTDVNRTIPQSYLEQLENMGNTHHRTNVLYIDNQNRNGAATCLNKESHDFKISRMLGDLMMLLSNQDDSYGAFSAITCNTNVFSVGYSECMYYFDDIKRYFMLANMRDMKEHILEEKNDEHSLMYKEYPLGLKERVSRFSSKYERVPFDKDINEYPDSIDKEIDDIIVGFKEKIISFSSGFNDDKKYPDYIDREIILRDWIIERTDKDENPDENKEFRKWVSNYQNLIEVVRSKEFKKFISELDSLHSITPKEILASTHKENPGCNPFLRFFKRSEKKNADSKGEIHDLALSQEEPKNENLEKVEHISTLLKERELYLQLKQYVRKLREELCMDNSEIEKFELTTPSISFIDIEKLKGFQSKNRQTRIDAVIKDCKSMKNLSLSGLFDQMKYYTEIESKKYSFIAWDKPFDFIKQYDVGEVCLELKEDSIPFVNTHVLRPTDENLTTYVFYSDRQDWIKKISNKDVDIDDYISIQGCYSRHIASKFCMFQFLQMDKEIIDGLTKKNNG